MIGTPDYEEWKSFRKTCSLAFIYQSILQGSAAVQQICKHGPVDVSSLAMRLTAGIVPLTDIRLYRHARQPNSFVKHCRVTL